MTDKERIVALKRKMRSREEIFRKVIISLSVICFLSIITNVITVLILNHNYNEAEALLNQKEEQLEFLERTPTVDISILDKIEQYRYVIDERVFYRFNTIYR